MSHLYEKPRPPASTGPVTCGHAVDSSAMVIAAGCSRAIAVLSRCRSSTASKYSRPPRALGIQSPCGRAVAANRTGGAPGPPKAVMWNPPEPVQRARQQEATDLGAAEVEHRGV